MAMWNFVSKLVAIGAMCLLLAVTACERTPQGDSPSGTAAPAVPRDLPRPAEPAAPPAEVKIDVGPGELDGSKFRHVKLGFSITFPESWHLNAEVEPPAATDPRTQPLLFASEQPPGKTALFNRSVVIAVRTTEGMPQMTRATYLEQLKAQLPLSGMPFEFDPVELDIKLGEAEFAALPVRADFGGGTVLQRYLVTKVDHYLIELCVSYENRAAYNAMKREILDTMRLEKP